MTSARPTSLGVSLAGLLFFCPGGSAFGEVTLQEARDPAFIEPAHNPPTTLRKWAWVLQHSPRYWRVLNQVGSWVQQEHLKMPAFSDALQKAWREFDESSPSERTLVLYPRELGGSELWSYALLQNRFEVRADAVAHSKDREAIAAFLREHPQGQVVVIDDGAYSGATKREQIKGIQDMLRSLGHETNLPKLVLGCATQNAIHRLESCSALGGLYVGRTIPTVQDKLQQLERQLPPRKFRRLMERYIELFAFRDRGWTVEDFVDMVRSGATVAQLAREGGQVLQLRKSVTTLPHKSPDGQSNLAPPTSKNESVVEGRITVGKGQSLRQSPRKSPLRRSFKAPYEAADWWRAPAPPP